MQIGLLALGVFGYVHTVLPVFQNQLLQEQAAKLELEKDASEKQLVSLKAEKAKISEDIRSLQDASNRERLRVEQLTGDVVKAKFQEEMARRQTIESRILLERDRDLLDALRWELVMNDLSLWHGVLEVQELTRDFNSQDRGGERGNFLEKASADWPKPYEMLMEAVDDISHGYLQKAGMPDSYFKELRQRILPKQSELQCEKPDFAGMRAQYEIDRAALEPEIDQELKANIQSLFDEYVVKKQLIEITDQYRASVRISISVSKYFALNQKYQEKINALRKRCLDKADNLLHEIYKEKGLGAHDGK